MKKIFLLVAVAVSVVSSKSFAEVCQLTDGKRIASSELTLGVTDLFIQEIPGKPYIVKNISRAEDCFTKAVQSAKAHTNKSNALAYTSWNFGDQAIPVISTSASGNVPVSGSGADDESFGGMVDAGTDAQKYAENDQRSYKAQQNLWACGVTLLIDGNNVDATDKTYTTAVYGSDQKDSSNKVIKSAKQIAMQSCKSYGLNLLISFYGSKQLAAPTHAHCEIDDGAWDNSSHDIFVKGALREKAIAIQEQSSEEIGRKVREQYKDITDASTTK